MIASFSWREPSDLLDKVRKHVPLWLYTSFHTISMDRNPLMKGEKESREREMGGGGSERESGGKGANMGERKR